MQRDIENNQQIRQESFKEVEHHSDAEPWFAEFQDKTSAVPWQGVPKDYT